MDPGALRTFDEQSLSGKIIHVDRQGKGLAGHPFCPEDDNLSHVCTKVYAMGFRNPFRFQLRPGGAGPVLGDVGWESYEELDLLSPGGSYGWPCYEGATHTPDYSELPKCKALYAENPPSQSPPVHTYPHSNGGGAVVAGPQYTATRYPAQYRNLWFFGDYVRGWLRTFNIVGGQVTNVTDFAPTGFGGVDLELTPEGDLAYLLFTEGSGQTGRLERIVYGNRPPPAVAHATPAAGASPLHVDFSADESLDPDGDTVTYAWDFGDGSADATGRTASHTYPNSGVYTARLTVRDARGLSSEDTVQVLVDRTPPVAAIEAPADGSLFRNGVPVQLHGSATDLEDGDLGDGALSWHIVLHHGSHTHSQGDLHGADAELHPARGPRRRLLLRDRAHGDGLGRRRRPQDGGDPPGDGPLHARQRSGRRAAQLLGGPARRAGEAHRRHRLPHVRGGARPVHARRHRLHLQGLVRRWGAPAPDRRARRRGDADRDVHGRLRAVGRSPRPAGNSAACRLPRRPHGRRRGCASTARAGGRGP